MVRIRIDNHAPTMIDLEPVDRIGIDHSGTAPVAFRDLSHVDVRDGDIDGIGQIGHKTGSRKVKMDLPIPRVSADSYVVCPAKPGTSGAAVKYRYSVVCRVLTNLVGDQAARVASHRRP